MSERLARLKSVAVQRRARPQPLAQALLLIASLVAAAPIQAAITIIDSGVVRSYADRNGVGGDEKTAPATTSVVLTTSAFDSSNTTNYKIAIAGNAASFDVQFNHTVDGFYNSHVLSSVNFSFRVDTNVSYEISGGYQLNGLRSISQSVEFYEDGNFFAPPKLKSHNSSGFNPNQSFTVGQQFGPISKSGVDSLVQGSTTGMLQAGTTYRLNVIYALDTAFGNPQVGASAIGDFHLKLGGGVPLDQTAAVPEPSTFLIMSTAIVGLGLQRWRKKKTPAGTSDPGVG